MNVTSFIFFHDKLFFFSFSSQTDNALFFSTFCEWLMRKTSIFILCKFILEFLILKSMQILIFILIWLDFVLFDSLLNNWWGRRQYFSRLFDFFLERHFSHPQQCLTQRNSICFKSKRFLFLVRDLTEWLKYITNDNYKWTLQWRYDIAMTSTSNLLLPINQ